MELHDQLEAASTEDNHQRGDCNTPEMIPRPSGTAGTDFSIQVAMGLEGAGRRYEKYKAIQVGSVLTRTIEKGRQLTAQNARDVCAIWSGMHASTGSYPGPKCPLGTKPCYSRL